MEENAEEIHEENHSHDAGLEISGRGSVVAGGSEMEGLEGGAEDEEEGGAAVYIMYPSAIGAYYSRDVWGNVHTPCSRSRTVP